MPVSPKCKPIPPMLIPKMSALATLVIAPIENTLSNPVSIIGNEESKISCPVTGVGFAQLEQLKVLESYPAAERFVLKVLTTLKRPPEKFALL